VAATGAQAVFLGTVDVPTVAAFMKAFQQQHYNPKILAATAGPDQGAAFIKAVGKSNATGIMTANGWYGGSKSPDPLARNKGRATIGKDTLVWQASTKV